MPSELPHGGIRLIPVIETARGVRDVDTVRPSGEGIAAAGFSIGDCLADMATPVSLELRTIRSLAIVEAACAAGPETRYGTNSSTWSGYRTTSFRPTTVCAAASRS